MESSTLGARKGRWINVEINICLVIGTCEIVPKLDVHVSYVSEVTNKRVGPRKVRSDTQKIFRLDDFHSDVVVDLLS